MERRKKKEKLRGKEERGSDFGVDDPTYECV
jgi:hypothetical protein